MLHAYCLPTYYHLPTLFDWLVGESVIVDVVVLLFLFLSPVRVRSNNNNAFYILILTRTQVRF